MTKAKNPLRNYTITATRNGEVMATGNFEAHSKDEAVQMLVDNSKANLEGCLIEWLVKEI